MHKIDQYVADLRKIREEEGASFIVIHNRIMNILGWRTVPVVFNHYILRSFRLVRWPDDNTLRIAPPEGFLHERANAWWGRKQVPNQDVQDAFFRELENEVAE